MKVDRGHTHIFSSYAIVQDCFYNASMVFSTLWVQTWFVEVSWFSKNAGKPASTVDTRTYPAYHWQV